MLDCSTGLYCLLESVKTTFDQRLTGPLQQSQAGKSPGTSKINPNEMLKVPMLEGFELVRAGDAAEFTGQDFVDRWQVSLHLVSIRFSASMLSFMEASHRCASAKPHCDVWSS